MDNNQQTPHQRQQIAANDIDRITAALNQNKTAYPQMPEGHADMITSNANEIAGRFAAGHVTPEEYARVMRVIEGAV